MKKISYVKTDVGELPAVWEVELLDNVAERKSGHTPDKKIKDYWDGTVPWISLKDLSRLNKRIVHETTDYTTKEGIKNSSAVLLPEGTIVISRDATVGKVGILSREMATSQHFINYICGSRLDNIYLYYHLLFRDHVFQKIATGSTIKTIGLGFFKKLKVAVPPIHEQQKIASILSTWDRAIELKEQLIKLKKEQKHGLLKKLFNGGVKMLGFVEEWRTIPIEKVCQLTMGKTPSRKENMYWGTGYKWIAISDMKGKYISKTKEEITEVAVKETGIKIIPKNSVIMSFKLTLGRLSITGEDMYSNEAIVSFKNKNKKILDDEFLYYYLSSIDIAKYGSRAAKGITLNKDSLKEIIVRIPSLKQQVKIRNILNNCDNEIDLLEKELKELHQQKKGLMQLLLTGKVRVKV